MAKICDKISHFFSLAIIAEFIVPQFFFLQLANQLAWRLRPGSVNSTLFFALEFIHLYFVRNEMK